MGAYFKLQLMKTAMSLALARIELMKDINPDSIHWEMFKNDCMEKEKEQIIDAYCDGFKEGSEGNRIMSEEYYNQTYNQNK
jgi:hypothetical protein